ncbi:vanadium-dependent haloperoxidase [Chryseolinea sp. T2]|uniref:vanadium-dependent haloperoxidase n=1 Tax=Chryseolinea sp. T2 TaxID=3129255 RepID=UPI0030778BE8
MKPGPIILAVVLAISACSRSSERVPEPLGENNVAYRWAKIALECTARDTERFRPRPTVTSRILALIWISVFDSWSRYDDTATPVYATSVERRSSDEHTLANKEKAISYAAYRAMKEYYFSDSLFLKDKMRELGFDPEDHSLDPTTPTGIGNLSALATIKARSNDGSNERGTMSNSDGTRYADYTGYVPMNTADKLVNISRWQPKYFADGKGGKFCPACLTPHWSKVTPFALDSPSQLRPGPPPAIGSKQLETEVKEVVDLQSRLTNEQKALVEFMRDGPKSVQQAGHWLVFAQHVSARDHHTLDEDVKMYFLVETAAMDAFIAAWDAKMYYDFARPYQLVHDYYQNEMIKGWGGPTVGMTSFKGSEWRPYSPDTFLCPPFPSYVSGHSCVSGACAEVLKLFTKNDDFDLTVRLLPGALTEPEHVGDSVTINFPTLTETANMAGQSRVLGGYHIQADNVEGLKLGRGVAHQVWSKYMKHVSSAVAENTSR